jgi:uncharacterized protein (TIGR03067 family)
MRAVLLIAVLAVAAPVREGQRPSEKSLQDKLVGAWESVKVIGDGNPIDLTMKIVFTPTEAHVWHDGVRMMDEDGRWAIDATKNPATIDIDPNRKGDKRELGILKIEGDTLTICVILEGDGPRPTEFKSAADSKTTLVQFKRVPQ